jgi:hypothetical protein
MMCTSERFCPLTTTFGCAYVKAFHPRLGAHRTTVFDDDAADRTAGRQCTRAPHARLRRRRSRCPPIRARKFERSDKDQIPTCPLARPYWTSSIPNNRDVEAAPGASSAAIEPAAADVELPTHTMLVSLSAARSDRRQLQTAAPRRVRRPRTGQRGRVQDPPFPPGGHQGCVDHQLLA